LPAKWSPSFRASTIGRARLCMAGSSSRKKKRPLAGPPIACAIHLRITGLSHGITNVTQVNTFVRTNSVHCGQALRAHGSTHLPQRLASVTAHRHLQTGHSSLRKESPRDPPAARLSPCGFVQTASALLLRLTGGARNSVTDTRQNSRLDLGAITLLCGLW
jgi:hypothetical protein